MARGEKRPPLTNTILNEEKEKSLMKKLCKFASLLTAGALTLAAFASCQSAPDDGKKTIGVIQYASHASLDNCYQGLLEGLKEAGYTDGETCTIDFQNANNSSDTASQIAQTMAAKKYDVIIGIATPAATAAFSACRDTEIPTVFCAVTDPVSAKLVSTLDAPGLNCTGTSDLLNVEGQLKMIRAFQPDAKKIGILYTFNETNSSSQIQEFQQYAAEYGFEIVTQGVQNGSEVAQAAATLVTQVDCLTNLNDNNVVNNLGVVLDAANNAGIPVYGSEIEQVRNGCLASESLDYVALGRETGAIAGKVLGGQDAATVPVGLVKDSKPVVNPDVATALGLAVPAEYQSAEQVTAQAA